MINRIFSSKYVLPISQIFTLAIFILLIYGSIGITTDDASFAKILRNTNLANLIIWSYWWPFIIVTAILAGRFWCTICPVELVTSFFGKIGLKKKPKTWLKSGWISTLFYMIILIVGIHTLAIHRIPQYMAIYMLVLLAVSIIVGLIWEKRTFCTYVCPIGHLLGLYSMLSSKKLRVLDKNVCQTCKTKDCIASVHHYKLTARSCTSELYPPQITDNRDCILCGQCHKSCTKDNISIQTRRIASDLWTDITLKWAEIGFFMLVSGFVIYEILSEWSVSKEILLAIPHFVNNTFQITSPFSGTVKAFILFIIFPLFFYTTLALFKVKIAKESWKNAFSQLVMAILPITASMHLVKAFLKTTSRIPYWSHVFADTKGVETAQKIMDKTLVLDKTVLNTIYPFTSILIFLLPLSALLLSAWLINKRTYKTTISKGISYFALIIYASLFLITLLAWRFL